MARDAESFIELFTPIPEEMWCTEKFMDDHGRCCAEGHCGSTNNNTSELGTKLCLLFFYCNETLWQVNDGTDSRYQQPTPKQRVLAALNDIKNKLKKDLGNH